MTTYHIADTHFFHKNIIKYCARPYDNVSKMNNCLINNWNSIVKLGDTVYVEGDLALGGDIQRLTSLIKRLNGNKHLILGNHDELNVWKYLDMGFLSVHTSLQLPNGWYLAHDPAIATALPKGSVLICGHVHTLFSQIISQNGVKVVNVGVDVRGMKPTSQEQIEELLK